MTTCEMCGKEGKIIQADIEGVEMGVCPGCSKYGQIKKNSTQHSRPSKRFQKNEPNYILVQDFASLIKSARNNKSLNQEDFAKFLNEKESLVAKWEQGSLRPGLDTARRLERNLGIRLVKKDEEKKDKLIVNKKNDEFTLGDFIKIRKRKS